MNRSMNFSHWQESDDHYRPLVYKQIATAFNISLENQNLLSIYHYIDAILSEDFEGILTRYNFSHKELRIMKEMHYPILSLRLDEKSTTILASRFLNPVLESMKARIGLDFNQILIAGFQKAKFVLFSSHDFHMTHILKFLNPKNIDILYIPFASVILYELHQFEKET